MIFRKAIPYVITINASSNGGYIIDVGCAKMVYSRLPELIKDLTEFMTFPEEVVKKYNKEFLNITECAVDEPIKITI